MKYQPYTHELFEQFPDYDIVKSIHSLTCKDDDSGDEAYDSQGESIFQDDWTAIDLDELEKAQAQLRENKNPQSSMDMAFAICEQNQRFLVLVEYRFNFKILSNITKEKLDDKVACSSACVQNDLGEQVYEYQYFVFAKNRVEQGRNRLQRMNPKCNPNYLACGVQDLLNLFFK